MNTNSNTKAMMTTKFDRNTNSKLERRRTVHRTQAVKTFGEVLVITAGYKFEIKGEIKPEAVSPETTYAAYLVFKLPQDPSTFEAPIELTYYKPHYRSSFIYLVSPPVTPVIGPKLDENTYNPLNRYKWNALPQQRTDGWIEVKVWEFQSTSKSVPMNLYFEHPGENNLSGLMIQGIELRPI
ncbi:protein kinase domain, Nitrogen network kinase 1, Phloem protein 2-like protein [Artemisia annua]|uniref:Protein kinase domain, Nitrogen network kinase 1, Phloem protein 2-like protein n=1 Tax=Artemisia annua TaxID=35608 RepID=A0A2U1KRG2_ARTAN|nr:protein kinase domain, Nitrogen network kinase 1, Phloem protein 2-like protein [Artemisia annua]